MEWKIPLAVDRMTDKLNFTFNGPLEARERGHIINMTNQLKSILLEVKAKAQDIKVCQQDVVKIYHR